MKLIDQEISRLIQEELKFSASSEEIEQAKLMIEKDPYNFRYVSEELKNDLELAKIAVKLSPYNFEHVSKELKNDLEFATWAVKAYPHLFESVSKELKNNLEFAKLAVEAYPGNFGYASDELRNDLEFTKWVIEKGPENFQYVSDELKNSLELAKLAVGKHPDNFGQVSDELKGNLELAKIAVEEDPRNLEYVSDELKNNLELARLAVGKSPYYFEYVSEELKGNLELAKIAVEEDPRNLEYVSDELKNNLELAKYAVGEEPYNFFYVSEELKGNLELAKIAVEEDPRNLEYVSDELKNNLELARLAVEKDPGNLKYISEELQNKLSETSFHDPHKSPEQIEISKNTPFSLYNLVRHLEKSGLEEVSWETIEKLDLTEDKHTNNLIREYNQTHVSPLVKKFVQNLDPKLSKQEQQQKIKEYRGKLNSEFKIPVEFIVESRSFHSEKLGPEGLKQPKSEISKTEEQLEIKTLDISDPEISEAIKEFRNIILNKSVIKHKTWTGAQKIFPSTNHVMMLVIPKDIIPPILYDLNRKKINAMTSQSSHPFIKGNLTIGWIRYTLGKDITGDKDNEDVWIDEVQTDFSSVFGKENMKQVFPVDKISYLLLKKSIKFIRAKGFEKIYLPTLGLASHLYSRGQTYSPPYTSVPQKLRFKKTELNDFHDKVNGNSVWVLAKKKYSNLDYGYTFE